MKAETYDLVQERRMRSFARSDLYVASTPSSETADRFIDRTTNAEELDAWFNITATVLPPGYDSIKLPKDTQFYDALYTREGAYRQLKDTRGLQLTLTVLRNHPFDMGMPLFTRVVVTDEPMSDIRLLRERPLVSLCSSPAVTHFAESPLLYDPAAPEEWVITVTDVMDELREQ